MCPHRVEERIESYPKSDIAVRGSVAYFEGRRESYGISGFDVVDGARSRHRSAIE
jgi:hypothetical protein